MGYFSTTPQDWFNFIAQGLASNALIQYVLRFSGIIDYEILKKAVLNTIKKEPVLGCRFSLEEQEPLWIPEEFDIQNICSKVETQNIEQEINRILAEELDASAVLPVKVNLITDSVSSIIVIKINHAVCDGAGSKYYLKLLGECYTKASEDKEITFSNNTQDRSSKELYSELGINNIEKYFNPEKLDLASTWGFASDRNTEKNRIYSFQQISFDESDFLSIKNFTGRNNTTINSILVAAYHFALTHVLQPPSEQFHEIQLTCDLRKYLPSDTDKTICNLSAIFNVRLPAISNIKEMIAVTTAEIKKANTLENIIHGVIASDLCQKTGFSDCVEMFRSDWGQILSTGLSTPMISNLGILLPDTLKFGDSSISDIDFISPAFFSPAFMLGVSSYKNKLKVCASYYTPGIDHFIVEGLMEKIKFFINKITD